MKKILCVFLLLSTVFFSCVSSGKKDTSGTDIALTGILIEKKVINDRKAYVAGSFAVVKEGDLSRYVNLPKKDQTGEYTAEIGEIFGFRKDNEKLCEVTTAGFFEVIKTAEKRKTLSHTQLPARKK
ncbi:hypothetical protein K7I13_06565 [Brucepastera parasyntrophica]|uniref:hypothetical protein n=1 Tax=Brucepastera parasyntrophica TaxID=2880008 RepID=UPI002109E596|nr:hypothetical protein [Brucepastera parasyntrophica]ULQ60917.1 hypothetical protein K7I13_06565 [Brucepastera parasyntrophica]